MPVESILYLVFVMAMFVQFAAVLAYAEWATRHINDDRSPFGARGMEQLGRREDTASLPEAA